MQHHIQIAARPFGFPYDGQLDPASTALLVIDLRSISYRRAAISLGRATTQRLRAILPTVNAVIHAARETRCPFIVSYASGLPLRSCRHDTLRALEAQAGGLEGTNVLMRSSPGFEIVPEITIAPGDIIVDKIANGAFTYTDLEQVLRARGITHLLFCGCTTDVCVHSTLRKPQIAISSAF